MSLTFLNNALAGRDSRKILIFLGRPALPFGIVSSGFVSGFTPKKINLLVLSISFFELSFEKFSH